MLPKRSEKWRNDPALLEAWNAGRRAGIQEVIDACSVRLGVLMAEYQEKAAAVEITPETPIQSLDLTGRTTYSLEGIGVRTFADLIGKSKKDLLLKRNIGPLTVKEIETRLLELGWVLLPE